MTQGLLLRLGAISAMLAGILRIGASFLDYSELTPAREVLYLAIDLCILFGVVTIYLYQHEQLGKPGIVGFVAALSGAAIIAGPDGYIGSVNMYPLGSGLLLLGLAVIAVVGWRSARIPRHALASWLASAVLGVGSIVPGAPSVLLVLAGLTFGFGFLSAGARIWSNPALPST